MSATKIQPPAQIHSESPRAEGCDCWYDKRGRLILWVWGCRVHPGGA